MSPSNMFLASLKHLEHSVRLLDVFKSKQNIASVHDMCTSDDTYLF